MAVAQELTPNQKRQIVAGMRNGQPFRGSSDAAIPVANYAFKLMGERTRAISSGEGFLCIHDAIATFVQYRNTISGLSSDRCLVPPRMADTPGMARR